MAGGIEFGRRRDRRLLAWGVSLQQPKREPFDLIVKVIGKASVKWKGQRQKAWGLAYRTDRSDAEIAAAVVAVAPDVERAVAVDAAAVVDVVAPTSADIASVVVLSIVPVVAAAVVVVTADVAQIKEETAALREAKRWAKVGCARGGVGAIEERLVHVEPLGIRTSVVAPVVVVVAVGVQIAML